ANIFLAGSPGAKYMSKKEIKLTPSKIRKKRSNNLQLSRNIYSATFLASDKYLTVPEYKDFMEHLSNHLSFPSLLLVHLLKLISVGKIGSPRLDHER
ncbi:MAG: hypothetical protein KH407_04925, partial [Streptococcus sp.]|nr:hypothetical protein [Streptococcus sp.]